MWTGQPYEKELNDMSRYQIDQYQTEQPIQQRQAYQPIQNPQGQPISPQGAQPRQNRISMGQIMNKVGNILSQPVQEEESFKDKVLKILSQGVARGELRVSQQYIANNYPNQAQYINPEIDAMGKNLVHGYKGQEAYPWDNHPALKYYRQYYRARLPNSPSDAERLAQREFVGMMMQHGGGLGGHQGLSEEEKFQQKMAMKQDEETLTRLAKEGRIAEADLPYIREQMALNPKYSQWYGWKYPATWINYGDEKAERIARQRHGVIQKEGGNISESAFGGKELSNKENIEIAKRDFADRLYMMDKAQFVKEGAKHGYPATFLEEKEGF